MIVGQNLTKPVDNTEETIETVNLQKRLKWAQDQWISYCASSGISVDEDGNFETMTVTRFATAVGVSRTTLYDWKKSIPNFWKLVDERAREMFNHQHKYAIMKGLSLKAMTGDVKAAEFVLSHYSDYTPPAQKHEVKLSGWADMVRQARTAKIKSDRPDAVEAEVIPQSAPPITDLSNPLPTGTRAESAQVVDNSLVHQNVPKQPSLDTLQSTKDPAPHVAPRLTPKQGGLIKPNQPIIV